MPRKEVSSPHLLYRVAYLVSPPIQYSNFSVKSYQGEGYGTTMQWDVPLRDDYPSQMLPVLGNNQRLKPLHPLPVISTRCDGWGAEPGDRSA